MPDDGVAVARQQRRHGGTVHAAATSPRQSAHQSCITGRQLGGRNPAQMRHRCRHRLHQRVHLLRGVLRSQRKPDAGARAAPRSSPIASSTCEGSTAPLEQAEPLDTAKPRRSSAITIASPSMPSKQMLVVFGMRAVRRRRSRRRRARAPESPLPAGRAMRAMRCDSVRDARQPLGGASETPPRPARSRCPRAGRARDARRTGWDRSRVPLRT